MGAEEVSDEQVSDSGGTGRNASEHGEHEGTEAARGCVALKGQQALKWPGGGCTEVPNSGPSFLQVTGRLRMFWLLIQCN